MLLAIIYQRNIYGVATLVFLAALINVGLAQPTAKRLPRAVLVDSFEVPIVSPFVPGYKGLPATLFPLHGRRWTQLQNTHAGLNSVVLALDSATNNVTACFFASGQPGQTASKMAFVKDNRSVGRRGDIVQLAANSFFPGMLFSDIAARNSACSLGSLAFARPFDLSAKETSLSLWPYSL